ncbi:unnamed protein product [Cylindrotheca closterium]|uniref:Uncharacterized protein n=1 Tax=Cylindrotheca closterium TaxID=2856 RepID=A0AAD2CH92_9STRA|nr:unnamed protein product [Cylindrotheca closterium]
MSSKDSTPSSLRKSSSIFEHEQSLRSIGSVVEPPSDPSSFRKSFSRFEHRQSVGSSGSLEVPPAFRASLNIFEDGEERNPLLPSFFRGDSLSIVERSDSSNDLKNEFVFSLKHAKVQEGPSLSIKQITDFQAKIRGYLERKVHKKSTESVVLLQSIGRGFLQRGRFHTIIGAAIRCQAFVRRYLVQRESRRLYDIQNPPHIRKLRNQIAAIRLKLDAVNEERECMHKERERRKAQIKKECLERFAKQERDKTLGIAHVQKSGSQLISYFQNENNTLRATMRDLAKKSAELRSENKSLESDNQVVAQYTHELHSHYKMMKERNGSLQKQADKLRNHYKPKWEDAIAEQKNHVINEVRQKYVYRQGLFKIVDNILLDQSCDSDFKDGIARVVGRCENDFDCEIDIDTPLELYPSPPEQQSMLSTFKPEDEMSLANSQEDEPFEFLDDAAFLLPDLESFSSNMHTDGGNVDDSSSTASSASSASSSDSNSSSDSSDDRSLMRDRSFKSAPTVADSPKDIVKYFEQNDGSAISPIAKKLHTETDSTVYSTDESEFEVKSAGCDTGKVLVNANDDSDTDSGTETSRPPWETEDESNIDPDFPTVINIPSTSELEGKKEVLSDAFTLSSTASTTAIESHSSSSYLDVHMESRNKSLMHPIGATTLEPDDNEEYNVGQSSFHSNEPTIGFHHQPGDSCYANDKEEKSNSRHNPPHQVTQHEKPLAFNGQGIESQPTGKGGIITSSAKEADRAKPKSPVRIRQESTKSSTTSSVETPKPFHARPAPKFGEPKIPVRARNPAKLRSAFKTRTAPEKSPPRISARTCSPTKLRTTS